MTSATVITSAAMLLLHLASFALAQELQSVPTEELVVDDSRSDRTNTCILRVHDCEVCAKDKTGTIFCSSIGIACQPKTWSCFEPDTRLK